MKLELTDKRKNLLYFAGGIAACLLLALIFGFHPWRSSAALADRVEIPERDDLELQVLENSAVEKRGAAQKLWAEANLLTKQVEEKRKLIETGVLGENSAQYEWKIDQQTGKRYFGLKKKE